MFSGRRIRSTYLCYALLYVFIIENVRWHFQGYIFQEDCETYGVECCPLSVEDDEVKHVVPANSYEKEIMDVLKSDVKFAAKDFSEDTFDNELVFGPIAIMRGEGIIDCPELSPDIKVGNNMSEWDDMVKRKGVKYWDGRSGEFFQEVGFIEFLRNHYPRSFTVVSDPNAAEERGLEVDNSTVVYLKDLNRARRVPRVFLPFCGVMANQGLMGHEPLEDANITVSKVQKQVPSKNIFYVVSHPGTQNIGDLAFNWMNELIFNARALKIDQVARGFFYDIIIPVSTMPSLSNFVSSDHMRPKENLIYSCGRDHSFIYKGIRSEVPRIFNSLGKEGIDMSLDRTPEEFELGFFKSKFCFILPGDTTGTVQASRAMLAGCVPIFITRDFRDLPFSNILNYTSFSIRLQHNFLTTDNEDLNRQRATNLYDTLEEMVINGTYDKMRESVEIVRDFFNYHRFGSRSAYGAALLSMYKDELDEYN